MLWGTVWLPAETGGGKGEAPQPGTRCARLQERARWELRWCVGGRGHRVALAPKVQEQPGAGSGGPGGQRSTSAAKGRGRQGWGSGVSPDGAGNLSACLGGGWRMRAPWLCGVSPQARSTLSTAVEGRTETPPRSPVPAPAGSPRLAEHLPRPCLVLLPRARGCAAAGGEGSTSAPVPAAASLQPGQAPGLAGTQHLGTFPVPALLRAAPRGSAPGRGGLPGSAGCRDQGTG